MPLDVVIGLTGVVVTLLVVAGMILITPYGAETSNRATEMPGVEDVAPPVPATIRAP